MSSLFGALDTAVSGLSAQSAAFSNISDNVANSQTTGFKGTNTDFADYLTTSTASKNDSGFVAARPEYLNTVQGTISSSDNTLGLAISGNGFFQVSQVSNDVTGTPTLSSESEYTRDGNFSLDSSGYLVNDNGEALNGWTADPTTGIIDESQAAPILINQTSYSPVPTSTVTLSANLPATPAVGTPVSSQVDVYDATGTMHTLSLAWTPDTGVTNQWTVAITTLNADGSSQALGGADITFGDPTGNNAVPAGTIGSIVSTSPATTSSDETPGQPAALGLSADFGNGSQTINLSLGSFGKPSGLTQYAGTAYTLSGISQNGVPPGAFSGVTTEGSGNIVANYNNGQTRIVARVPLVNFAAADALQRQNGQAFTATESSGVALTNNAGSGGTGTLVTSSLEGSNVDIATEFTKLIVAQQAYAANAKVVTTANTMLQQTLDMKQ